MDNTKIKKLQAAITQAEANLQSALYTQKNHWWHASDWDRGIEATELRLRDLRSLLEREMAKEEIAEVMA